MNRNHHHNTLPDPDRPRQIPPRFSWIDHRLVRDAHLSRLSTSHAAALYLALLTVSDARGLSYYSDKRLLQLLPNTTTLDQLGHARRELIHAELIAHRPPHYQILSLDPDHIKTSQLRRQRPDKQHDDRDRQPLQLKDALRELLKNLEDKV